MSVLQFRVTGNGADGGGVSPPVTESVLRARTARVGLWIFLMVISVLFFLFLFAFMARAQLPDWRSLTGPAAPLADTLPLWLNSAMLLCASLSLQCALDAARHDYRSLCRQCYLLGGLFALGFLSGQLWVWHQLAGAGFLVNSNPAYSFYLLTGLHGLHLLGGVAAWAVIARHLFNAGAQPSLQPLAIELCARYWHFLLGLWLALFLALTRSPETYHWLAALCGLR